MANPPSTCGQLRRTAQSCPLASGQWLPFGLSCSVNEKVVRKEEVLRLRGWCGVTDIHTHLWYTAGFVLLVSSSSRGAKLKLMRINWADTNIHIHTHCHGWMHYLNTHWLWVAAQCTLFSFQTKLKLNDCCHRRICGGTSTVLPQN